MDIKTRLLQWKGDIDRESIDVYLFLQQNYTTKKENNVFRFVYRSFYRLDNAGLSENLKEEYFKLLKNKETSLKKILVALHKHKTLRGLNSYQLSFATKLLHTIDNNLPIYDSSVAHLFKFPKQKENETKIEWCINKYNILKKEFDLLLNDNRIQRHIKEFKKKHQVEIISDAKVLDFMLWSLGKKISGQ